MATLPQFSGLSAKRIPTLVGLVILVVALILGTVFFQQGLGVFAPRATPETTPKQVRITNLSDNSFTISFMTEAEVAGFVKYGTEENSLKKTAIDDRDTLTSTIGKFKLHHITLRGLEPNTTYYYVLGTGDGTGALFDNNGAPFKLVTARRSGSPSAAKTIHGSVTTESGAPAEGAIVFITIDGASEMSSLVKNSGGWAVPLSNARTPDGSAYASITDETNLQILVQGPSTGQTARGVTTVKDAQPVPTLSYGQTAIVTEAETEVEAEEAEVATLEVPEQTMEVKADATSSATQTATTSSMLADSSATSSSEVTQEVTTVDLTVDKDQTVTTTQPTITGQAAPNVTVTVEVHSDTQITHQLVANADGSFSIDIAELKKELEPGEHTVTYSYVDPVNGETVTKTETFFVEPQNASATLAQATASPRASASPRVSPSPSPFGTDNPFPIEGATNSANSSNATKSGTATSSGRTSNPSTSSGMPVSGSVGTTLALIFGGLFFIISGAWSFWVSKQYSREQAE